jgi:hypothetical protein
MKAWWLIVAALLLVGCDTTSSMPVANEPAPRDPAPSSVQSPTASAATPRCSDQGVEFTVGEVDGAMGLRAVGLTLRNCGTASYAVNGYPVIDLLDADRKVLRVAVLHGTEHVSRIERFAGPPKRIVVAPGRKVGAVLVWRNLTTVAEEVATGDYLSVAPTAGQPRQEVALTVDLGNTGRLAVSPWTAL